MSTTGGGHNEIDIITPTDHLSPPSTTSRLSDSDTSECDLDGLTTGRDGASISSMGSSSSPPPEVYTVIHFPFFYSISVRKFKFFFFENLTYLKKIKLL